MDCTNWFYLCLTLCGVILAMLAMFFNYSLKLDLIKQNKWIIIAIVIAIIVAYYFYQKSNG